MMIRSQTTSVPDRGLDRLLVDEINHRVANEVAAALAAMHLARSAKPGRSRDEMLDVAIDRLEGFGESSRVLASVNVSEASPGEVVERLCRAMTRSRTAAGPSRILLSLCEGRTPGQVAHRIALIAYELITNALKYGLPSGGGGELEIRLEMLQGGLVLSVIDDGPGLASGIPATSCADRLGGRIVAEIVRSSKGSIEYDTGPGGTAVHVMLPVA